MTRYRVFTGKGDEDIDKVAEVHLEYYKEIFKDDFIINEEKFKSLFFTPLSSKVEFTLTPGLTAKSK